MEEKEERALIKSVTQTIVKWIIGFFLTSCVGLTGFYFNTQYVTAQNTKDIKDIKDEVKKVTTVPVLNQNKIKNIQKELTEFKETYKENDKENKESIKEMRKEMQKMIELLYQIRNSSR